MSERARQALELYRAARVEDQLGYYRRAANEYQQAGAQGIALAAILLSLTSGVAAIAGLDIAGKEAWAVAAAVLPAISTALGAFVALFAFDRVAKLYEDAVRALAAIEPPDLDAAADEDEAARLVAAYVEATEAVMGNEQAQWGQLTAELKLPEPDAQR